MRRPWITALLAYAGVAGWLSYPAWTNLRHGMVGDWTHPDMLSNQWLYGWVAERLWAGEGLLHNDRYYFPVGDAPVLAGNGSDAVGAALLAPILPWPGSVTVWALLTLVGNGLAGALLARVAGARGAGALAAGMTLVLSPYVSRELAAGRFAQAPQWPSALFLAAWIALLRAPSAERVGAAGRAALAGRGVAAGLAFAVCAVSYWYAGWWMALAGALLAVGALVTAGPGLAGLGERLRARLPALGAFLGVVVLLVGPALAVFLGRWAEVPGTAEDAFPHPITVDNALPAAFPLYAGRGELATVTLPLALTVLAAVGYGATERWLRRGLVAAAILFYLLALGPELLALDGTSTGVPGPFALLYGLAAPLRRFWWPYRHVAPLTLALLPLMAHGVDRVVARVGPVGAWLVVAALPLDLYARGATVEITASWYEAPAAYARLAELPAGHLLELPVDARFARTQASLVYQRAHGRTLVNGHGMWVDRVRPAAWDAWLVEQPLLAEIAALEAGEGAGEAGEGAREAGEGAREAGEGAAGWTLPEGACAGLVAQGVRYVSVNREFYPGQLAALRKVEVAFLTAVLGEPVVRGGGVRIWDLAAPGACASGATVPAAAWVPPDDLVDSSGRTSLPGDVSSSGVRSWPRAFPPAAPSATVVSDAERDRWAELPPMLRRRLERDAAAGTTDGDDTGDTAVEEAP